MHTSMPQYLAMLSRALFCLLIVGSGCSTLRGRQTELEARVGHFKSSPRTFDTNLFWIEGDAGVVLVDTGFLPSDARELRARAERETSKPVVLAIVLHANPDKFNGAHYLLDDGVPVITSQQVAGQISAVHASRHRSFASRYPGEYPAHSPKIEVFGGKSQTLRVAGLTLKLHVMGAGCSKAHVALQWRDHLFVGDLVANRVHSWLELGLLHQWKATIHELMKLKPRFVYPGRGAPGGPELLTSQTHYLQAVEAIVSRSHPKAPLATRALQKLAKQVEGRFPDYDYPVFLKIGLPALVESAGRRTSATE